MESFWAHLGSTYTSGSLYVRYSSTFFLDCSTNTRGFAISSSGTNGVCGVVRIHSTPKSYDLQWFLFEKEFLLILSLMLPTASPKRRNLKRNFEGGRHQ